VFERLLRALCGHPAGDAQAAAWAAGDSSVSMEWVAREYQVDPFGVRQALYSDATVANRNFKVWHGATEKGP
jgi:hypothetical protein